MIKIAAITTGKNAPSARFRVRQHVGLLREQGVVVEEQVPRVGTYDKLRFAAPGVRQLIKVGARLPGLARSYRADVTWLQRPLIPRWQTLERFYKRPIVFDVDDAIWLRYPRALPSIAKRVDRVIAGNVTIAGWFEGRVEQVDIVATAIDTERFKPEMTPSSSSDRFRIGWTGTSSNFPFLEEIAPALGRVIEQRDAAEVFIMADRRPELPGVPASKVRFERWTPGREVAAVASMDVGLMPLPDNEWAAGKCSFKMLQYMSCGVPVVVAPVGMNADVLAMGDVGLAAAEPDAWEAALLEMYDDRGRRQSMGAAGRKVACEHFDRRIISAQLADVFKCYER